MDVQISTELYGDDDDDIGSSSSRNTELDSLYDTSYSLDSSVDMDKAFQAEWEDGEFCNYDDDEYDEVPDEQSFDVEEAMRSGNAEDIEYFEDMLEACGLLDSDDN